MTILLIASSITGFMITSVAFPEEEVPLAVCIISVLIIIPYFVQASMQYIEIRQYICFSLFFRIILTPFFRGFLLFDHI